MKKDCVAPRAIIFAIGGQVSSCNLESRTCCYPRHLLALANMTCASRSSLYSFGIKVHRYDYNATNSFFLEKWPP